MHPLAHRRTNPPLRVIRLVSAAAALERPLTDCPRAVCVVMQRPVTRQVGRLRDHRAISAPL